jgi:REP element-mobilizing transposase RayT
MQRDVLNKKSNNYFLAFLLERPLIANKSIRLLNLNIIQHLKLNYFQALFHNVIPSVMKQQANQQQALFQNKYSLAYGGLFRKKAKNRGARPLTSKGTLHVVMRSSFAKGLWSFRNSKNILKLGNFIQKFSQSKGVEIISLANVGNHYHLHVRIPNRTLYKAWIRGLSSGMAMLTLGLDGLKQLKKDSKKFWDYRPFTRVINNFKSYLNLKDYIQINQLEAVGLPRVHAVVLIKGSHSYFKDSG